MCDIIKILLLEFVVESGMAAGARWTFQGLEASHTDSETTVA